MRASKSDRWTFIYDSLRGLKITFIFARYKNISHSWTESSGQWYRDEFESREEFEIFLSVLDLLVRDCSSNKMVACPWRAHIRCRVCGTPKIRNGWEAELLLDVEEKAHWWFVLRKSYFFLFYSFIFIHSDISIANMKKRCRIQTISSFSHSK